jgi:phosphate starvation-inducible protein PhoH and related proteins
MVNSQSILIDDNQILLNVCGINDKNLRKIETITGCHVFSNGNEIFYQGENSFIVERMIRNMMSISTTGGKIYGNLLEVLYKELERDINIDIKDILNSNIEIPKVNKVYNPRTINQGLLIQLLKERDIVLTYGPAGTGKTFISIAFALNELLNKNVKKIVLTRPIIEAGENLGFLPGDYIQKINPYLVPLFDAINFILPPEVNLKLSSQNLIEIAPLAYMRGRTFENSIVILDEAQNTTCNQMKLFLTRLGEGSKLIITGDITQIDLPRKFKSGMVEALEILGGIDEIGILEFHEKDVVRHPLVKKIISAYTRIEKIRDK